ncbi:hypothetical protein RJ639_014795 [Escallonia herrerae]|uniref:Retrovirus-related Pol polyprotein from transposon TNT 1-94-like beta-barrel domain-containing protein n=1 Tax=Escallonia herrerae TaxID=1293975 RepID=A0AA89AN45_9ASTE|nr:hypothetical protein RJ639_014795 [Escallonia herrerae]
MVRSFVNPDGGGVGIRQSVGWRRRGFGKRWRSPTAGVGNLLQQHRKSYKLLHMGLVQVAIKPIDKKWHEQLCAGFTTKYQIDSDRASFRTLCESAKVTCQRHWGSIQQGEIKNKVLHYLSATMNLCRRSSVDVIEEEDAEKLIQNWSLPKVSSSDIYKKKVLFERKMDYETKTIEKTVLVQGKYVDFELLERSIIQQRKRKYNLFHLESVQVAVKPLTINGLNNSVLLHSPNDTFPLDVLTLNVKTVGFQRDIDVSYKVHYKAIIKVESAKEALQTLINEFQGDDKVRAIKLQPLRKDLENMKMKEVESLKDYSNRFLELINQMKTHGENISDQRIVEKTLISLPEKFDPIVVVIEATKDLSTLSVQEVMASLKSYEQRMAKHTENVVESAFLSKSMLAARAKKENHITLINLRENQVKVEDMEEEEVEIEEEAEATLVEVIILRIIPNLVQQASFTEAKESEASLFYACQSATKKNDEMWFLDSGCSNHMAREKSLFLNIDSTVNTKVKLGIVVQAQGKGTIGVQTKQGTRFIRDVLLDLDLEHNLLSLGQLLENDYSLQFHDKCCIIYDKRGSKDVVTKIKMEKNINFPINFRYTSGVAMKASIVEDSWLWHRRFGHINFI